MKGQPKEPAARRAGKRDWALKTAELWLDAPTTSKYSAQDLAKLLRRVGKRAREYGKREIAQIYVKARPKP